MGEGRKPPEVVFETNDYGRKRVVRVTMADMPEIAPVPAFVWVAIAAMALAILAA